jgi:hypothetical protein
MSIYDQNDKERTGESNQVLWERAASLIKSSMRDSGEALVGTGDHQRLKYGPDVATELLRCPLRVSAPMAGVVVS